MTVGSALSHRLFSEVAKSKRSGVGDPVCGDWLPRKALDDVWFMTEEHLVQQTPGKLTPEKRKKIAEVAGASLNRPGLP